VPVTVVWPLLVTVVAWVTLMSDVRVVVTWAFSIPCWPAESIICASVGGLPCGFRKIWFWLNWLKFPLELSVMPDTPDPSLLNAMKLVIILFENAVPWIDTPPPLLLVCGGGATRSTGGPAPRLLGPIKLFWIRVLLPCELIRIPGPAVPIPLLEIMFPSAACVPPMVLLPAWKVTFTPPMLFGIWTDPTTFVPILLLVTVVN